MTMNLAGELSRYALSLGYADLDERTVHSVKQRLVDSLGCGLGAFAAAPVRNARAFALEHPSGASTILGTTPDVAAFVNGAMVRYFDFNDGYIGLETGHPSDNIPACLAVAESEAATGEDLIVATALAYEIQCRFQDAANLHRRGWDHVNYLLLSSTVAAGRLMRLSEEQLTQAINIAMNSHIAMRQARSGKLSHWKACSGPNAARNGIVSASLARHGLTGPSPIFEGDMGFMKQITGAFSIDTAAFGTRANPSDEVLAFMGRISVTEDPTLTAMLPRYIPNRVTVRLSTGDVLTEEVLDVPGGARVPVTDGQLEDKFHGLLRPFASDAQRASILSHAWGVERAPCLAPLFASMTLACRI